MITNLTAPSNSLTSFLLLASGAHVPMENRMLIPTQFDSANTTAPTRLPSILSPPRASLYNATNFSLNSGAHQLLNTVEDIDNSHVEMVMHLITLLSSSTSLVMLCFSIITYSLFSDMRDLAGLVMLNASVALFFCQLLLLIGIDRVVEHQLPLCNAIATLMHLFWLAALFWFVIGIFDLAQDFRTRLAPSAPGNTLRDTLIAYCVVGWGVPVGIVFVCTILDNASHSVAQSAPATAREQTAQTGAFQYLHHFRTRCWFPDTHGVVFGLLIPFCLALPVVILCMRQTWYNIELTSRLSAKAGVVKRWKKPDAIMFELYIKLFCLSGVIWLLCFIAGAGLFPDDEIFKPRVGNQRDHSSDLTKKVHNMFRYAFEISLAMFGTCVSLLFTCNGAVFKAYASGRSKKSRRHSSIISSTGAGSITSGTGTYSYATGNSGIGTAASINLATIHESWSGERLMEADAAAIEHEEAGGIENDNSNSAMLKANYAVYSEVV